MILIGGSNILKNQNNRTEPNWSAASAFNKQQAKLLVSSLEQFELGYGGGPAYLITWNREKFLQQLHAQRLVDLWFKEEKEQK